MSGLAGAFRLLTRIPVGRATDGLEGVAVWFPVVGLVVGLAVGGIYALLFQWIPSILGAVFAVGAGVMLTGAIHEDGLADSMDAFGTGESGERALSVMRDSRLGTYGTLALVYSVLGRVVALGSLEPEAAVAGVVAAHTLGRSGAAVLMAGSAPARAEGLGRLAIAGVEGRHAAVAVAVGIGFGFVAVGWWIALGAVVVAIAVVVLVRVVSVKRIGGITGDVLGACEQLVEIGALTVVAVAAWTGWSPWWQGLG